VKTLMMSEIWLNEARRSFEQQARERLGGVRYFADAFDVIVKPNPGWREQRTSGYGPPVDPRPHG
jgi:hypothetical protein